MAQPPFQKLGIALVNSTAQAHYESQGFVKIAEPNVMGLIGLMWQGTLKIGFSVKQNSSSKVGTLTVPYHSTQRS